MVKLTTNYQIDFSIKYFLLNKMIKMDERYEVYGCMTVKTQDLEISKKIIKVLEYPSWCLTEQGDIVWDESDNDKHLETNLRIIINVIQMAKQTISGKIIIYYPDRDNGNIVVYSIFENALQIKKYQGEIEEYKPKKNKKHKIFHGPLIPWKYFPYFVLILSMITYINTHTK